MVWIKERKQVSEREAWEINRIFANKKQATDSLILLSLLDCTVLVLLPLSPSSLHRVLLACSLSPHCLSWLLLF